MLEVQPILVRAQKLGGSSLRARKRRLLMRHVQGVALGLFNAHGYERVTVEQIAKAADVSPSTIYRNFGTKEFLILHDEYHLSMALEIETTSAGEAPIETLAKTIRSHIGGLSETELADLHSRLGYVYSIAAVNSAMLAAVDESERYLCGVFARRMNLPIDSLELGVVVAFFSSAYRAGMRHWYDHGGTGSLSAVIEQALALYPVSPTAKGLLNG